MSKIKISPLLGLVVSLTFPLLLTGSEAIPLCDREGTMVFNLTLPEFELLSLDNGETRIRMDDATYSGRPGYPRLPKLTYTFALPPGSEVTGLEITGIRSALEEDYAIEATPPQLPRSGSRDVIDMLYSLYEENRGRVYSGAEMLSPKLGKIHTKGERREYSLVTVAVYPFYYDPVSGRLSVTSNITVSIHYAPVDPVHARSIKTFMEKGTLHEDVPACIYNADQARDWYRPSSRTLAQPGIIILTTDELKPYIEDYVSWRENTGFAVKVITLEEITESIEGADDQQKIRNWLRTKAADYHYLLIVGHHFSIPMRTLTLFNDNIPPSGLDDPDCYPHPSDVYYGDLSKPDSESWDIDEDAYYGEVLTTYGSPLYPDDSPDFEMELHVGRINSSSAEEISEILERIKGFEESKDRAYKENSVLVGGILGYYSAEDKWDDSYYMEYLMEAEIVDRSSAITLYEKEGDNPSDYDCDFAFTQSNLVSALGGNNVGIFVESNHGSPTAIFRTVWYDLNEDGEPQSEEIEMPYGLEISDAPNLNSSHTNVSFLLSCLCAKPEISTCLAQALLNHGSVGVFADTRWAWGAAQDWLNPGDGGDYDLCYNILKAYLNEENLYDYVLGDALSAGRAAYWNELDQIGDYFNAYGYTFYGDPSLRHFGRTGISESPPVVTRTDLDVDLENRIHFSLAAANKVRLEVWDVLGRRVEMLLNDVCDAGVYTIRWNTTGLPSGTYFLTLKTENITRTAKAVVIQ